MNADPVVEGLATVILIDLLVENPLVEWIERKTVPRWGMSAGRRVASAQSCSAR